MIAVQALEKRTAELKQTKAELAVLKSDVENFKATVAARLEALKMHQNQPIKMTAEQPGY